MPLNYSVFLAITDKFYSKAISDILIGYHFRVIEDFSEHIPRIASFWQLQVTGEVEHPEHFPFRMMAKHLPLKLKRGEIDRWIKLFFETLEEFQAEEQLTESEVEIWKTKVLWFRERFMQHPLMFS